MGNTRSDQMQQSRGRQSGFSLIEVAVASVIVIVAGLGIATLAGRTFVAQRDLDRLGQQEIIRRTLRTEFDCRKSLRISPFQPLPQAGTCTAFGPNKTLEILGRDGRELFPMHVSGEYYRVSDWHVRASCDATRQVRFEGRLNVVPRTRNEHDTSFGEWRDLFSGTSMFCREYLDPVINSCSNSDYPFQVGWDSRGAHCCRVQAISGKGSAIAACSKFEVMVAGGALCGASLGDLGPASTKRKVVREKLIAPGFGSTKSTQTTIAVPGVPHFLFPQADLISSILDVWTDASVPRGGFLAKSLPNTNDISPLSGVLSQWEAQCRSDDWKDPWPTKAVAICCPRRL